MTNQPGARPRAGVKHIAEEYGGRATAESTPAAGTTLRVVLPAPSVFRD